MDIFQNCGQLQMFAKSPFMAGMRSSDILGSDFGVKQLLKSISIRTNTSANKYTRICSRFWRLPVIYG
jgi:hypothetical protein